MVVSDFILLGCGLAAVIGDILIRRGRWGDRSVGRPRCPKCWYDMRGTVPRLVCPECGHDAVQEQHLYLDRRRPWLTVLGAVLLLAALLLFVVMLLLG